MFDRSIMQVKLGWNNCMVRRKNQVKAMLVAISSNTLYFQ